MRFNRIKQKWQGMSKKGKIITVISIVLVLLIASGALAYRFWFAKPRQVVTIDSEGNVVVSKEDAPLQLDRRINLLLIGVDERKNTQDKTYRTDTLILTSIDPVSKQISMLSIPRDTRVEIPKHGMDKINAAAAYGGLNMTVAVVQNLTGVKIDGYIKTNFDGFKSIIDTLGGVDVYVEKDMYYETGDIVDGVINLKKGQQVLDGEKALEYARFRHDAYADITRTARQQVVLKAIAKKLMQPASITKVPSLISEFTQAVDTNLPPSDLLNLAKVAVNYDSSKVISQTLPGYFLNDEGISYWGVDPDNVKKVVADLFNNGVTIGNTPDKLITASTQTTTDSSKTTDQEPEPQIVVGGIVAKAVDSNSVAIDVSPSQGVARAEVWRTTAQGSFRVGNSWSGTTSAHFVDSQLQPNNSYNYVLKVYDQQGNLIMAKNSNAVTTLNEVVTPQLPKLSVNSPAGDLTSATQTITISGTTDTNCTVYVNSQQIPSANGVFSAQFTLSPGDNLITVKAVNSAGATTVKRTVTYSPPVTVPDPQLTITSPANNTAVSTDTIDISGKVVEPDCTVTLNGQTVTVDNQGNFVCKGLKLTVGENTFSFVATNSVGKTAKQTLVVIRN